MLKSCLILIDPKRPLCLCEELKLIELCDMSMQMSKEYKFVNSSVSKDAFGVAISPNTDHSFIAALLIIQHELHKEHAETSGEIVGGISDGIFQGLAAALGGS